MYPKFCLILGIQLRLKISRINNVYVVKVVRPSCKQHLWNSCKKEKDVFGGGSFKIYSYTLWRIVYKSVVSGYWRVWFITQEHVHLPPSLVG